MTNKFTILTNQTWLSWSSPARRQTNPDWIPWRPAVGHGNSESHFPFHKSDKKTTITDSCHQKSTFTYQPLTISNEHSQSHTHTVRMFQRRRYHLVYTIRVTISCIYYFVFTISFYFMHFINQSGYLAASVQIKPVDQLRYQNHHSVTRSYRIRDTWSQLTWKSLTPYTQVTQRNQSKQICIVPCVAGIVRVSAIVAGRV